MKIAKWIGLANRKALQLLLGFTVALLAMGTVVLWNSPVKAINLEVIGQTDGTTSYSLRISASDIVFVECVDSGSEASLGYLSNAQAITCP